MADSTQAGTDRLTVVGIAAVGIAVAGFSASSLFTTATEAGVSSAMAWVLPVATDLSALICTRVWLSPRYGAGIRRYAAFLALADMLLSFLGAAMHLAISQASPHHLADQAPVALRLAVGGLPSLTLAAMVHLGALIAAERSGKRAAEAARAGSRRSRRRAEQPAVQTSVETPTADAPEVLHEPRPEAVTPAPSGASVSSSGTSNVVKIDKGSSRRAQMLAYLDEHPDATGGVLDEEFGTRNYGRSVRRAWLNQRQEASGQ